ncbi:MAG: hypothetical protein ABIZ80_19170 [Bryobacteraceae bacterium]
MNKKEWILTVVMAGTSLAFAQDHVRGSGREGGAMRFNPVLAAIDADHDGVLSADEISKASAALKTLDKNSDGQISEEEARPKFGGRGRGGPDAMVKRMMGLDKNGDGKLTKEEVPERMQGMFARGDANSDGALTEDEIRKMTPSRRGSGGGPEPQGAERQGGPGGFHHGDPVFSAIDADHDGVLSAEEIAKAPAALKTLDKSNDGTLTADEVRPSFGRGRGRGPGAEDR